MFSWIDGCLADSVSLKDRGLAYGDGVFETVAVKAGQPLLFERHLQRLESACQRLAIPVDPDLVRTEMARFASQLGDGVMKLILTRGDSQRGYGPAPDTQSRRILQGGPSPSYPAAHAEHGVCLFPCKTRLAEQPLLAGLKHLNRLEQVLARSEWQDSEHAEGLVCDTSGRLIEGVYSNLFLVSGGRLLTADLSRCGVAGVMRAELLDQARTLGVAVDIRDLYPSDLEQADEVFLCNSVYGIWPVCGFEHLGWPVGPLTRKLQGIARDLLDI
ncbi:aminodeoxychorismate lyase [Pseudomonas syringae]|uniref:Aminodeoxychorismate lyase n=1 Tax=Pseudomonas viridiflava TaxID=33069 RepID=A0A3M5PAS4_PSEVI|nr:MULTISPECIES: aminodeoxychorismate lyase [Pseudomonas syringae group]MCF5709126.1 aminodeoxychorismate lyase [Pseudomonas syringae]RMT81658.1 4-amino-4-deoxychorismate lyase [Pseudomonas viridiflava]